MASYNKITLVGNVGNDPQLKVLAENRKVTELSVAINEKGRNGQPDKTEWYRVSLWDAKADIAANYVRKGNQVYIEGRLSIRTYVDKEGRERYQPEVTATEIVLLSSRDGAEGSSYAVPSAAAPSQARTPVSEPVASAPVSPISLAKGEEEDDLPF